MDISLYLKGGETVSFAAGDVIFRRGDEGDVMYLVKEGEVELSYGAGEPVVVGPGESFGEMALIERATRSADGRARTDCVLYPIKRGLFMVLVQETPDFAIEVMRSMSQRLRAANTTS
ncbi:MAG: cyclic nucleotide-binding domain-containing protein [Ilumatobacteraceae bacterium]|nr:cyclic nucleotide-binding domain-containing protein [Ilumatobacteraceae bacterium]